MPSASCGVRLFCQVRVNLRLTQELEEWQVELIDNLAKRRNYLRQDSQDCLMPSPRCALARSPRGFKQLLQEEQLLIAGEREYVLTAKVLRRTQDRTPALRMSG